jgi:hypothetical protein
MIAEISKGWCVAVKHPAFTSMPVSWNSCDSRLTVMMLTHFDSNRKSFQGEKAIQAFVLSMKIISKVICGLVACIETMDWWERQNLVQAQQLIAIVHLPPEMWMQLVTALLVGLLTAIGLQILVTLLGIALGVSASLSRLQGIRHIVFRTIGFRTIAATASCLPPASSQNGTGPITTNFT